MIQQFVYSVIIVSFPNISAIEYKLNKLDYNPQYNNKQQNSLEYNYIRTKDYIQENIQKYQDIDVRFHHQNKD